MTESKGKIVFTGGHHTSALAVALELKKKGCEVYWMGHKYSMWGDKNVSAEFREVTSHNIPFFELTAGKFHRTYSPLKLARIPIGFWQAFQFLRKIKPNLIVSFGSYLAVPVAIVGWMLKIPVVTHEQTSRAVISNEVISHFAQRIFITFPSSLRYFPANKTVLVGLPLAEDVIKASGESQKWERDLIFITGGKQGAHVINEMVKKILPELLSKYKVVHQTGASTVFDDYSAAKKQAENLPKSKKPRYRVVDFLLRGDMVRVLTRAALVVSRSGAHVVYELGVLGIPSLLVPIPARTKDEQTANAKILKDLGSAEVINQEDLTAEKLLDMINLMMKDIERYRTNAKKARSFLPTNAKEEMVEAIERIMGKV